MVQVVQLLRCIGFAAYLLIVPSTTASTLNSTVATQHGNTSEFLGNCCAGNEGNCVSYARCLTHNKLPHVFSTCAAKRANSNTPTDQGREGCVLFRTGNPTYCHAEYISGAIGSTYHLMQSDWPDKNAGCTTTTLPKGDSVIIGVWCP